MTCDSKGVFEATWEKDLSFIATGNTESIRQSEDTVDREGGRRREEKRRRRDGGGTKSNGWTEATPQALTNEEKRKLFILDYEFLITR